ncbi:MAG: peroxiredoxin-like family protein [Pseudomonadota bacterium]
MTTLHRLSLAAWVASFALLAGCSDHGHSVAIAADAEAAMSPSLPDLPTDISPLLIGEPAPAFTLPDAAGEPFTFDPEALERPVVLVFYRGGWCPYCSAHMMELRKAEQNILDMGFDLIFTSPDRSELLAEALAQGELDYTLLSDTELKAARGFGVAFRVDDETAAKYLEYGINLQEASGQDHQGLPVPAVFIIGTDGMIRFEYINPNYKVRIGAELLLAGAEAALSQKPLKPLR